MSSAEAIEFRDPEQAELELKITKDIQNMPEDVRDRFKALKVLYDRVNAMGDEEEKEYRQLEVKYEKKYAEVYAKRAQLLSGAVEPQQELLDAFEKRHEEMKDESYETVDVDVCDVKDVQKSQKGVPGFWFRAMLANGEIGKIISEKDRAILAYLQNIELNLHEEGYGFELKFTFEENSYFKGTELTKTFVMGKQNVIEKCIGTKISWVDGCDPTQTKKKKKSKTKNGNKKTSNVTVKCDSFFNFFETIDMDETDVADKPDGDSDDDQDVGEKMDIDFDLGQVFKDDVIPLALEYYLGVIQDDEEEEDDEDDDSDDDDKKPKKAPKKGKAGAAGAVGKDGQECKQQ